MTATTLDEAERKMLGERLASWFGDDRQAFLVSHLAPAVERILAARAVQRDCTLTDGRNRTWYSQDAVNELRADREAAEREQSEALADVMMWQERYGDLRARIRDLPITCIDGVNYVSRRDLLSRSVWRDRDTPRATGAVVPDHIRCTCPADFCIGVPGETEGPRICRACMALDPEEGCIREQDER